MEKLTDNQKRIYEAVNQYLKDHPGAKKKEAFKAIGTSSPTYSIARRKIERPLIKRGPYQRKKKQKSYLDLIKKPPMITIQAEESLAVAKETSDTILAFIGNPDSVVKAVREYLKRS